MTGETTEGRPCGKTGKRGYRRSEKWFAARRKLHADPTFKAEQAERMRKLHADPTFNPLASLTKEQRENYDLLVKKGGYTRKEALEKIAERPTKIRKGENLGALVPGALLATVGMDFSQEEIEVRD